MTDTTLAMTLLGGGLLLAALAAGRTSRRRRLRRRSVPPPASPATRLGPLLDLLRVRPFDLRSGLEQRRFAEFLRRADLEEAPPDLHAKINLLLAEMALVGGDREGAREHFRAALRWDPRLNLHRTLERLDPPAFASLLARRSA